MKICNISENERKGKMRQRSKGLSVPYRIVALFLALIFLAVPVYADSNDITVLLNGSELEFDVPPVIVNGRTMVPMRKIFESLGAVVIWDDATRTVTGKKDGVTVNVTIDSSVMFVNGTPINLDTAPFINDGRTLVPVRAIAESFNCRVDWIDATRTVTIDTDGALIEKTPLVASEISQKVSPSVFYIEVYDEKNSPTASGSGFFIAANGVAVTNYHVIDGTYSSRIMTTDGRVFDVTNVIAFDEKLDVALIKVSTTDTAGNTVSGFPALVTSDSDLVMAGQTVYALGSPAGLRNTISDGIISNAHQIVDGYEYIQITAPISHGSSGGALVNEYGEVIGITSGGIDEAQNIGFAIPINVISAFDTSAEGMAYSDFSLCNNAFTLELSTDSVTLEVGQYTTVYVHADGKSSDWTIYWEIEDKSIVNCEWGNWLDGYDSVCPLYISAKKPGKTNVIVYSDVDFVGKAITVTVTAPEYETYPKTSVPTYSAVTGAKLNDRTEYTNSVIYSYNYKNINTVQGYVDLLLSMGCIYMSKDIQRDHSMYHYLSPEGEVFTIDIEPLFGQVWISVPR